jgi:hypothetical protein
MIKIFVLSAGCFSLLFYAQVPLLRQKIILKNMAVAVFR